MGTADSLRFKDSAFAPAAHGDDLNHSAHVVQFYGEDSSLLDDLAKFIGNSLGAGEAAIVIATKEHRRGLVERLKTWGLDTSKTAAQGRYLSMDAGETLAKFMVDGMPDEARFAEFMGGELSRLKAAAGSTDGRVAAFGEMVALLWMEGKAEAAVRLEQLWNDLAQAHSFSLRCAYPMSGFYLEEHGDLLLRICAEHSAVIPGENYTALAGEDARLRSVACLQQKAQALENEIAQRKHVEEKLRNNQAELEFQVARRTASLRQLSSRLLNLQDSERKRIARELHDSLGQYLIVLKLNLDILRDSPEQAELWRQSQELMESCINEVRTLSYLLYPPTMDAVGIASAARWYIEGFGVRSGVEIKLSAPQDAVRLPDAIEVALFRVLQEALTNVHRHSGATAAEILIQQSPGQVTLEVRDNGHGMEPEMIRRFREKGSGMGVGLLSMDERTRELGGEFSLESDSTGTSVRITIPVGSGMAAC